MNEYIEKRKSERIPLNNDIEVSIIETKRDNKESIHEVLNCKCLNISTGGILIEKDVKEHGTGGVCIKTSENITVGTHILLQVHLKMDIFDQDFTIRAVVVNSNLKDNFYYISISFQKLINCSIDSDIFRKIDSLPGF